MLFGLGWIVIIGLSIGIASAVYFVQGARKQLSAFDHDGDGKPGGSLPKAKIK